jgi:hypothetical protein
MVLRRCMCASEMLVKYSIFLWRSSLTPDAHWISFVWTVSPYRDQENNSYERKFKGSKYPNKTQTEFFCNVGYCPVECSIVERIPRFLRLLHHRLDGITEKTSFNPFSLIEATLVFAATNGSNRRWRYFVVWWPIGSADVLFLLQFITQRKRKL